MTVLKVTEVEQKLRELNGNMAAAARHFGVTRAAVWKLVQNHPSLKAAQLDSREGMKDNAESSLYRAVLAGEAWAVCFFLKTQAKDRGYIEQLAVAGPDGGAIPIEFMANGTANLRAPVRAGEGHAGPNGAAS